MNPEETAGLPPEQKVGGSNPLGRTIFFSDGFHPPSDSVDHGCLTDHPPAIPSASGIENQRGNLVNLALREAEGTLPHPLGEQDPRLAIALENHTGISLASGPYAGSTMPESGEPAVGAPSRS